MVICKGDMKNEGTQSTRINKKKKTGLLKKIISLYGISYDYCMSEHLCRM